MKKLVFLLTLFILVPISHIQAQSVDILWEGVGYVSPFYQGKSLWSKQAEIILTAIPQGLGTPANLNYVWIKNGTVLGLNSGVGRNSLTLSDSIFSKPIEIKVEIVNAQEDILAQSSVTLTPTMPQLFIYENNPLYGFMFHREVVGGFRLPSEEITFSGFPFFFSTGSRSSAALNYRWVANGIEGETLSSVTYRVPEGSSGYSNILSRVSNQYVLSQTAERNFLVQFGSDE